MKTNEIALALHQLKSMNSELTMNLYRMDTDEAKKLSNKIDTAIWDILHKLDYTFYTVQYEDGSCQDFTTLAEAKMAYHNDIHSVDLFRTNRFGEITHYKSWH